MHNKTGNKQIYHSYEVIGTDKITLNEFECALKSLKNGKATGINNIYMEPLKYCGLSLML
jgi:hypothetical protein